MGVEPLSSESDDRISVGIYMHVYVLRLSLLNGLLLLALIVLQIAYQLRALDWCLCTIVEVHMVPKKKEQYLYYAVASKRV